MGTVFTINILLILCFVAVVLLCINLYKSVFSWKRFYKSKLTPVSVIITFLAMLLYNNTWRVALIVKNSRISAIKRGYTLEYVYSDFIKATILLGCAFGINYLRTWIHRNDGIGLKNSERNVGFNKIVKKRLEQKL